jgi:hypothetical protein
MKFFALIFILFSLAIGQEADIANLAKSLKLSAGSKAVVQWERIFKSKRKMKKYKIDTLSDSNRVNLKEYLINHAIDSDQPTIAGV